MLLLAEPSAFEDIRARDSSHGSVECRRYRGDVHVALGLVRPDRRHEPRGLLLLKDQVFEPARLRYLRSEPVVGPFPTLLHTSLPLRRKRVGDDPIGIEQPFLKTYLENEDALIVVGERDASLLYSRKLEVAPWKVWTKGIVLNTPASATNDGALPALQGRTIGIIGLGSIGSRVAIQLAAAGVERLWLADHDVLEARNLRRHLCGPEAVGLAKVEAVAQRIASSGFGTEVTTDFLSLPRSDSVVAREKVRECDLLICCADAPAAQHHTNVMGRTFGMPTVVASIKLFPEAMGEVVISNSDKPGCYNCLRLTYERQGLLARPEADDPGDYGAGSGSTPSGIPVFHLDLVASVASDMAMRALSGQESCVWMDPIDSAIEGFSDLMVQQPKIEKIAPVPDCRVCGERP